MPGLHVRQSFMCGCDAACMRWLHRRCFYEFFAPPPPPAIEVLVNGQEFLEPAPTSPSQAQVHARTCACTCLALLLVHQTKGQELAALGRARLLSWHLLPHAEVLDSPLGWGRKQLGRLVPVGLRI